MKKLNTLFLVCTITSMLVGGMLTLTQAQNADNKAKNQKLTIDIEIIENGEVRKISRELDAIDGDDIHAILREMDVLDDIDISGSGERIEIKVKKKIEGDTSEDVDVHFSSPSKRHFQWNSNGDADEKRPLLGVFIESYDNNGQKGALVTKIVANGAAEKAGLNSGDVVIKINSTSVNSEKDLRNLITQHEVGEKITVEYLRDGVLKTKKIALGESSGENGMHFRFDGDFGEDVGQFIEKHCKKLGNDFNFDFDWETDEDGAFLGVTPGVDADDTEGVLIGKVIEGASAEKIGLKAGDRVTKLNGKTVKDFDELADVISAMKAEDKIEIAFTRDGKTQTVNGSLGKRGDRLHEKRIMKLGSDCGAPKADGSNGYKVVKEVSVVIELKDVSTEEEEMLADPASVDFNKELALNRIQFAPNPNDGLFNLEFELPKKNDTRILVFDQSGRQIYQEQLNNFKEEYSNQIDISSQPNGVYFLIIAQDDKQFAKKIVKQ